MRRRRCLRAITAPTVTAHTWLPAAGQLHLAALLMIGAVTVVAIGPHEVKKG
jgi:hypothetical protein